MRRKIFTAIFILTISLTMSYGQAPKFVNEFLNIGVGARAHGMSGSMVANVSDVTAAFWNPAGLTQIETDMQIAAMHTNWFGGISNYDYVGLAKQLNPDMGATAAVTFIRLGVDNIPNTLNLIGPDGSVNYDQVTSFSAADYAVFLSYSSKISEYSPISLGGSIKVIRRSIGEFGGAWGFGADFGAQYRKENFTLGIMGKDITTTFLGWTFNLTDEEKAQFTAAEQDIPISSTEISLPRIILGGSYFGGNDKFGYLVEANLNFSTNGTEAGIISSNRFAVDPSFGVELSLLKKVYFRVGIGNIQRLLNDVNATSKTTEFQPNIGMGVNLGQVKIDYALSNVNESSGLLRSHIFSLTLDLKKRNRY